MSHESPRRRRVQLRWVIGVALAAAWIAATVLHLAGPRRALPWLDERSLDLMWDLAVLALLLAQSRALWRLSGHGELPPAVEVPTVPGGAFHPIGGGAALAASNETTATPREEYLEWAYRLAARRMDGLEQRWGALTSGSTTALPGGEDRGKAVKVADRTEELASACRALGDPDSSVRNLLDMAARLRAAAAADGAGRRGLRDLVPLPSPAEWRAAGGEESYEYLRHLLETEARAEALASASRGRQEIDWRGPAQALLKLAGPRRPPADAPDPHRLRELHAYLLELLCYEEIAVRIDDPVDRDIHDVEGLRPTREHRPNRVVELVAPGYIDRASGKVWRKAVVVLSEQPVG